MALTRAVVDRFLKTNILTAPKKRGQSQNQHPLFPRKRTFRSAVGMSALCMVESKDITTFCEVAAARAAQIGWPEDFPPAILLRIKRDGGDYEFSHPRPRGPPGRSSFYAPRR